MIKIYYFYPLKKISYINIGGRCKKLIISDEITSIIPHIKKGNYKFIGNTSNILFNFKYSNKTFIKYVGNKLIEFDKIIIVESGISLSYFSKIMSKNRVKGFSHLGGIPCLLGGAVVNNASCFLEEISTNILYVECVDENGDFVIFNHEELSFKYRSSFLKGKNIFVYRIYFKKEVSSSSLIEEFYYFLNKKKSSQPYLEKTLGSTFINKPPFFAGREIEKLNLKELRRGNTSISSKHANFIVLNKEKSYKNMIKLIERIFLLLYNKLGVNFILEIELAKRRKNMGYDPKMSFDNILLMRKNRARSIFLVKIVAIFVIFASVVLYFFAPISQVSNYRLEGNIYFTKQEVLDICFLTKKTSLYKVDKKEVKELLDNHPLIKNSKVSCSIFGFGITFEEICPVGKYKTSIYMSDGSLLTNDMINDDLIGEHLVSILSSETKNVFDLEFDPTECDKNRYVSLCKTLVNVEANSKNYIAFVDIEQGLDNFYLHRENDDYYLKIDIPALVYGQEISSGALEESKINKYYDLVDMNGTHKINLTKKTLDKGFHAGSSYYELRVVYNEDNQTYVCVNEKENIDIKDN